jgi:hypothetical protein
MYKKPKKGFNIQLEVDKYLRKLDKKEEKI